MLILPVSIAIMYYFLYKNLRQVIHMSSYNLHILIIMSVYFYYDADVRLLAKVIYHYSYLAVILLTIYQDMHHYTSACLRAGVVRLFWTVPSYPGNIRFRRNFCGCT